MYKEKYCNYHCFIKLTKKSLCRYCAEHDKLPCIRCLVDPICSKTCFDLSVWIKKGFTTYEKNIVGKTIIAGRGGAALYV